LFFQFFFGNGVILLGLLVKLHITIDVTDFSLDCCFTGNFIQLFSGGDDLLLLDLLFKLFDLSDLLLLVSDLFL